MAHPHQSKRKRHLCTWVESLATTTKEEIIAVPQRLASRIKLCACHEPAKTNRRSPFQLILKPDGTLMHRPCGAVIAPVSRRHESTDQPLRSYIRYANR